MSHNCTKNIIFGLTDVLYLEIMSEFSGFL